MTHELMQFFAFAHLPATLQAISQPFGEVAGAVDAFDGDRCDRSIAGDIAGLIKAAETLPENCERTECMRKLRAIHDFVRGYGNGPGGGTGENGMRKTPALRGLLEAKDCAVRAVLYKSMD